MIFSNPVVHSDMHTYEKFLKMGLGFVSPPWWVFSLLCVFCLLSHHTVVWGILSLLCVCFFVCTVTDFSAAEKDGGMKFCMRVGLLSGQVFSHFGGQGHQGQKGA